MFLKTAGLLIVKNKKLLLAFSNNKKCYYLPGGKIESNETSEQGLCREIAEELSIILQPEQLHYYTHITAPAYGEAQNIIMEQDCFFAPDNITPIANAEIGALKYFTLEEYLKETAQAPGAIMILQQLKKDDYIE
jgi:8-oxo-dGTP pyrophosphatase MutT (NUDIX family)